MHAGNPTFMLDTLFKLRICTHIPVYSICIETPCFYLYYHALSSFLSTLYESLRQDTL
jgi:hypothetical protein